MKKQFQSFVMSAVMLLINQTLAADKTVNPNKPADKTVNQAKPVDKADNPVKPAEKTDSAQDSKLNQERENTRLMIENVTADQKNVLDYSTTLGNTLNVIKPSKKTKAVAVTDTQPASDASDSKMSPIALGQWPDILAPSDRKLLVNPRPRGMKNDDGSLVYTPDFTRQRLTFGLLNDNPFIDLPNKELENESAVVSPSKAKVDVEKSLSLADLVYAGINYSPVMDQVQSQLDIAIAKSKSARADLFPKASAKYATGPERSVQDGGTPNNHTTTTVAYRLTQPLINLPVTRDWMSELSNKDAATWKLHSTKETVALAAVNAVINLATTRMILDFADEELTEFIHILEYIQSRNNSGAASVADVERTRTRVLQTQQARIELQANYRNALLEVQRLTGLLPEAIQLPYLNQLPGLPNTQQAIRKIVWENGYDLQTIRKEIKSQELAISSQYSRYLPTLSLSVERDENKNIRAVNPKQIDSRILAVLNWDVSLGGKEFFSAKAAIAELSNREARLNEEAERTMQGVDSDFALLQSATLRIATGQSEQQAAQIVLLSVREQIKSGRINSLLEALDANEKYFAARQRLVQTLAQQMQAQAQLLRRIGVLAQVANQAGIGFDNKASMGVTPPPVIQRNKVDADEELLIPKDDVAPDIKLNDSKKEDTSVTLNPVKQVKEMTVESRNLPTMDTKPANNLKEK